MTETTPPARPPRLTARESFKAWTHDKLRFADTDKLGHVNNAVFATLLETGRVSLLYNPERPLAPPGNDFVIARLELDFRAELHYPGTVDIGTGILSIGRNSFNVGQGLFEGGRCVGTANSVLVLISHETRRSVALPQELRDRLAEFQLGGG
ncbi:MAG TPA: thioesterase family protein [Stellaceae bacterium]|jgi:acyl-CoA thioester hydrolase